MLPLHRRKELALEISQSEEQLLQIQVVINCKIHSSGWIDGWVVVVGLKWNVFVYVYVAVVLSRFLFHLLSIFSSYIFSTMFSSLK